MRRNSSRSRASFIQDGNGNFFGFGEFSGPKLDRTGSRTWFLDSCIAITHRERRLLLTNHDLGVPLTGGEVQTGLNFADSLPELFAGKEMGVDLVDGPFDMLELASS